MKLAATALWLLLCSVSFAATTPDTFTTAPFDAEPLSKTPPSDLQRFERIVELCVKAVRGELPYSQFDAYVEGKSVNMIGTEESRFKFFKCMAKNGLPVLPSTDR